MGYSSIMKNGELNNMDIPESRSLQTNSLYMFCADIRSRVRLINITIKRSIHDLYQTVRINMQSHMVIYEVDSSFNPHGETCKTKIITNYI